MSHTISLLVINKSGMLVRIANLFSRRGYNIESLVVSPALDGRFSRMTVTAEGDPQTLEQIIKQVSKLVDVLHCEEHDPSHTVEKELALIKVQVDNTSRSDVLQVIQHFEAKVTDFSDKALICELTDTTDKVDSLLNMLKRFGMIEMVRTGKVLMARGAERT